MEPFQKKGLIDRYKRRLNMETAYTNINGQIWLFFDAVVECELVKDTEKQVTVRVFHHDLGQHMMMTFVYAKCSAIERLDLWDHLYYLASDMELPWLVGGDFNVLLHEDEKIGGLPVHPPEYEDFAFCVNSCGLFEQGYKGSPFTWWNGRSNDECISKRLYRIFVNLLFQNMLLTIEVEHLIRTGSDHAPLLMTCGVQTTNFVKPFRFLNFWTKHATFMDVVRQNWEADFIGDQFLMFKQNIKRVKAALSKWNRETFGDIFKQLAILEDIVRVKEMLFEEEPTTENRIVLQKAQSELKKYLNIEEQYWKQKAGMNWFAEGDRNTSFFHNHVNGKRKKLQLKRIKSGSGVWIEDHEQLATAAVDFYQKQFTNEGDASEFPLLNNVPSMVTMDQNLELSRLPTIEEVRAAVFELSGESASGPDGFTSLFIKHAGMLLVLSRVLHDRLEIFLPSLIAPNQSGFVKGRSIFENILLTQEIITDIRLRGKPANVVIKLDMAKAYDRVSWKYLLHVLRKMGFTENFINMVWNLMSNNWYSVLVNGQSSGFFKSTRGVKQGDPLSPTFFILSAEVLSRSLNKLIEDKSFVGFGMPKWSDSLNHLAYADDMIIFASAHPPSLSKIMAVLGNYKKISGQMINKDKSSYYMYSKVANGLFQAVGAITTFARGKFPFTYLGYPIFYTRRRKDYYEDLIKKVKAKLHSWKGKLLSFGGKATLISSVLQSMPVHMLSVLDPPNSIMGHLHKTFARFFWSTKEEGRSRHWASWQNLCLPKEEGVLGLQEVAELRQGETWDDQLLDQTFNEEIAEHIRLNVHYEGSEGYWDKPYWMPTPSGKFSVSSAWQILRHRADPNQEFKLMWIKDYKALVVCSVLSEIKATISSSTSYHHLGTVEEKKCRVVDLGVTTNVVAEAKAILQGLEYCVEHDFHPLILETGTSEFHSFSELPSAGRRFINIDKSQSPNLRIRIAKRRTPD
ncbi:uncharacterized protein LOC142177094 [Nicotiana tabacum]|uniref:Uncharacterized protein LOC142177094 n=1 Tax=Nicotiana tabacum TaxID=4097 RepID=A0AC58TWN8_TOBAC